MSARCKWAVNIFFPFLSWDEIWWRQANRPPFAFGWERKKNEWKFCLRLSDTLIRQRESYTSATVKGLEPLVDDRQYSTVAKKYGTKHKRLFEWRPLNLFRTNTVNLIFARRHWVCFRTNIIIKRHRFCIPFHIWVAGFFHSLSLSLVHLPMSTHNTPPSLHYSHLISRTPREHLLNIFIVYSIHPVHFRCLKYTEKKNIYIHNKHLLIMKRVAVKIEAVAKENENSGVQEYCMLLTVFFLLCGVPYESTQYQHTIRYAAEFCINFIEWDDDHAL